MAIEKVKPYKRKGKRVRGYTRKPRPVGKKRIISRENFHIVRDEFGHVLGYRHVQKKKK